MMRASAQAGFSLIETLVAMTVLAVSSAVILSATEAHTRTISSVSDRTIARWVAQNTMVTLNYGSTSPETLQMGGTLWRVDVDQTQTVDPDLARVDVTVAVAATPGVTLARLTGFIDTASGALP